MPVLISNERELAVSQSASERLAKELAPSSVSVYGAARLREFEAFSNEPPTECSAAKYKFNQNVAPASESTTSLGPMDIGVPYQTGPPSTQISTVSSEADCRIGPTNGTHDQDSSVNDSAHPSGRFNRQIFSSSSSSSLICESFDSVDMNAQPYWPSVHSGPSSYETPSSWEAEADGIPVILPEPICAARPNPRTSTSASQEVISSREAADDDAIVRSKSAPSQPMLTHSRADPVVLNVYDLSQWRVVEMFNGAAHRLGAGIYHVGIEVHFREWSFGRAKRGSGVSFGRPRLHPSHRFRCSLELGSTSLSRPEVTALLLDLSDLWLGTQYHIFHRNCVNFAQDFADRLGVGPLPPWLNRLAKAASSMTMPMDTAVGSLSAALRLSTRSPSSCSSKLAGSAKVGAAESMTQTSGSSCMHISKSTDRIDSGVSSASRSPPPLNSGSSTDADGFASVVNSGSNTEAAPRSPRPKSSWRFDLEQAMGTKAQGSAASSTTTSSRSSVQPNDAAAVAAELSIALAELPPAKLQQLGGLIGCGGARRTPEPQMVSDLDALVTQLGGSPQSRTPVKSE